MSGQETNLPILYFDDEKTHDRWVGNGDFQRVLKSVRPGNNGPTVRVAVTQQTFSRLPRIIAFASAMALSPAPVLPRFDVPADRKIHDAFLRYYAKVRDALAATLVRLAPIDPNLEAILRKTQETATDSSWPNFLRLLGVLSDDVFIGPHTFHLDLSNRCNTNCIFCGLHSPLLKDPQKKIRGRRFTEGWRGRTVDREIFANLVDDLAAIGTREDVLFSGEGEPMTHPDVDWMIRYVKERDLRLTLFTNGLKMTPERADMLSQVGLDILYWSLSAGNAKTFVKLQPARQESDYRRMIEVMTGLVEKKRKRENKPYIILAHVINALNFDECLTVMERAKAIGVDSVRYQVMHSCSSTESLLISKEQFEVAKEQIDKARKIAQEAGIEIVANIDFQLESAAKVFELPETVLPCYWSYDLFNNTGCLAGWFFSRSFTDGRISFCCHDKIVGSLYRGRFKDIWFSDRYREIRRRAKAFDLRDNMDLTDESCGGMLLDEDCNYCGNYEFINRALLDLDELNWRQFLLR